MARNCECTWSPFAGAVDSPVKSGGYTRSIAQNWSTTYCRIRTILHTACPCTWCSC